MKKMIERLLIFFIGVPLVFALVFFLPFKNHLALNFIIILFSAIGAVELSAMLEKKDIKLHKVEAFILGSLAPLAASLTVCFNKPEFIVPVMLAAGVLWVFISVALTKKDKMSLSLNRILGCLTVMVYPGFFMMWLISMSSWGNSQAIFLFLLIVFINDSAAWLCGSLFGKNNKGVIPASPNKSVAGFIGGILGSVLLCILAARFFVFPLTDEHSKYLLIFILIGLFTSIFANFGDLAESAIKRSCDFKDSGNLMLGRGGILDSIDSIAVAAPVYYFLFTYLFNL